MSDLTNHSMTMLLCTIHFSLRVPVFNCAILLKLRNVPLGIVFVQQHDTTTSSLAVQIRVHIYLDFATQCGCVRGVTMLMCV